MAHDIRQSTVQDESERGDTQRGRLGLDVTDVVVAVHKVEPDAAVAGDHGWYADVERRRSAIAHTRQNERAGRPYDSHRGAAAGLAPETRVCVSAQPVSFPGSNSRRPLPISELASVP